MLNIINTRENSTLRMTTTLLAILVVGGCATSSKQVDTWIPDQSYGQFEKELKNKDVRVYLGDGTTRDGSGLRIDEETTSWLDVQSKERASVPTESVWRLQTTNHGAGAARGFGIGLLAGAGCGALIGLSDEHPGLAVPVGAVLVGAVGGFLGMIVGGASGARTVYEINPALVPPDSVRAGRSVEPDEGG